MSAEPIAIDVGEDRVSGVLVVPADARALYVMAHGAGAGMAHPFLSGVASDLAAHAVATLRYQFPYMERRGKRPDPPAVAHAAVRAAVAAAAQHCPTLPLFAGGKSFGGRMTSQAQASTALRGVRGLAFLGFPLHPAGKPADERAAHLDKVLVPMLFVQGTRDELADWTLLRGVVDRLGKRATLQVVDEADHSFHVPARSGRKDLDVRRALAAAMAAWMTTTGAHDGGR